MNEYDIFDGFTDSDHNLCISILSAMDRWDKSKVGDSDESI